MTSIAVALVAAGATTITVAVMFWLLTRRGDHALKSSFRFELDWKTERALREQKEKDLAVRDQQYNDLYKRYADFVTTHLHGLSDAQLASILNGGVPPRRPLLSDELLPFPDGNGPNGGV